MCPVSCFVLTSGAAFAYPSPVFAVDPFPILVATAVENLPQIPCFDLEAHHERSEVSEGLSVGHCFDRSHTQRAQHRQSCQPQCTTPGRAGRGFGRRVVPPIYYSAHPPKLEFSVPITSSAAAIRRTSIKEAKRSLPRPKTDGKTLNCQNMHAKRASLDGHWSTPQIRQNCLDSAGGNQRTAPQILRSATDRVNYPSLSCQRAKVLLSERHPRLCELL